MCVCVCVSRDRIPQGLQRTRTSVDALTTEQLTEMRARISDEVELALEQESRDVAGTHPLTRLVHQSIHWSIHWSIGPLDHTSGHRSIHSATPSFIRAT